MCTYMYILLIQRDTMYLNLNQNRNEQHYDHNNLH